MSPPSQFQMRASLLGRLTLSGCLSLSFLSTGFPYIGTLYASAQTIPAIVRSGYTSLDRGWVNQAIDEFEDAVQRFPRSVEARLGLAIAYRRAGQDANAFQAYERVLAIDPTNRLALLSLGTLGGFRLEWQERGIAALTTLLQQNPDDGEARMQRALLYSYEGNFDAALDDYKLVLQKNPSPEAIAGAAQAYAYHENYDQSLALFNRYLQTGGTLQGDSATAYARVLRETGDETKAVQVLETALRQQTRLTDTALRMRAEQAMNYAAIDRLDLARAMLTPLRGRSEARMILGRALIAIGQTRTNQPFLSEGIALFKTVASETTISPALKQEIAEVLAGFPESQSTALDLYRQLEPQRPNDRGLQTQVAVLEHETGQLTEADLLTKLSQILPTIPTDPEQQQAIVRALIWLKTPNPLLLPLYENLVRAGITEPFLYFRIAQMYLRQGDFETARSVIGTYATTLGGKTDSAVELLLAGIDQRQGNLEASARRYQAIIDSNPDDRGILTGALQGLSGIYQTQGKYQEALVLYNRVIALNPHDRTKELGLTSLKYQAGILSRSRAEAVLNQWLTTQPLTNTPPELYSLVGALPAESARELLYRTLVQADPMNIPVQTRLVEIMVEDNQTAALAYVDKIIERDPDNIDVYFLQGNVAQLTGNLRLAASAYEKLLQLQPQNVDALTALGGIRFRQRRYRVAIELYSRVLALKPDHEIARAALADLELSVHRRIPALRQAEAMEQVTPVAAPDLSRSQSPSSAVEFTPQGNLPLPWERP